LRIIAQLRKKGHDRSSHHLVPASLQNPKMSIPNLIRTESIAPITAAKDPFDRLVHELRANPPGDLYEYART